MVASLTAVLEIDNIFANTDKETADLPGRELSCSSWLTHFPTRLHPPHPPQLDWLPQWLLLTTAMLGPWDD
jgi:hypothetical protein